MDQELRDIQRTALALGEIDPAELPYWKGQLDDSAVDRMAIQETRQLGDLLRESLATETSPGLSEIQRLAIESHIQNLKDASEESEAMRRAKRRARLAFWIPTSLAACALIASGIALMAIDMPWSTADDPAGAGNGANAAALAAAEKRNADIREQNEYNLQVNPLLKKLVDAQTAVKSSPAPSYGGLPLDSFMLNADEDTVRHAFHPVKLNPVCAVPMSVSTESYEYVRGLLEVEKLPPADLVQVEAMINSYSFAGVKPTMRSGPFDIYIEVSDCPWKPGHRLARVTLNARGKGDGAAEKDAGANTGTDTGPPGGEINVLARDARMDVEFNPARVRAYRLIGYENHWAGVNARKPAGADITAGYSMTMLYEIMPLGARRGGEVLVPEDGVGDLKYQTPRRLTTAAMTDELFNIELRYRDPRTSELSVAQVTGADPGMRLAEASSDFKFAAAVAQLGLLLIDSPAKGDADYASVKALAAEATAGRETAAPNRVAFLDLIAAAERAAEREAARRL